VVIISASVRLGFWIDAVVHRNNHHFMQAREHVKRFLVQRNNYRLPSPPVRFKYMIIKKVYGLMTGSGHLS
jgi:hypothetical protein